MIGRCRSVWLYLLCSESATEFGFLSDCSGDLTTINRFFWVQVYVGATFFEKHFLIKVLSISGRLHKLFSGIKSIFFVS